MAADPEHLREHYPNHLDPLWHLDAGHLLNCHNVGQVIHHAAEVVDSIRVGNEGVPGLALTHLLCAAVVIANIRYGIYEDLAIELDRDTERAVHAGMIRTEV